jgi:hypothetical protein
MMGRLLPTAIFLVLATGAGAVDRAAISYRRYCANCHDPSKAGHTPDINALRKLTAEAVLAVLETGTMKSAAESLTPERRRAVAEYVSGKKLATVDIAGDWNWEADCPDRPRAGKLHILTPDPDGGFSGSFTTPDGAGSLEGRLLGTSLELKLLSDPPRQWTGTVNGGQITGTVNVSGQPSCPFVAHRLIGD